MRANFSNEVIPFMQSVQQQMQQQTDIKQRLSAVMSSFADFFEADEAVSYVSIDDNYLEFFASSDAKRHEDEELGFRFGEELVGRVASNARILSANDEKNTFLFQIAAPMIQWDKVAGVLLLNYKQDKTFEQSELETLKTLAMFLTTVFSTPEVSSFKRLAAKSRGFILKDRLKGYVINKGYGVGAAVMHKRVRAVTEVFSCDKEAEAELFEKAKDKMIADLTDKIANNTFGIGEHIDILQTYLMLAQDKGWHKKIKAAVANGLTAGAAVEKVYEDMRQKFEDTTDIYLKERLNDLRDISDRLRVFLKGDSLDKSLTDTDIILVAQSMGPADLTDYDYRHIRGLVLEEGTSTMHIAIVAKALNIPVISKVKGLYRDLKEGEIIALDGQEGFVYINPSSEMKNDFKKRQKKMMQWRQELKEIGQKKSQTADRKKISINLNIGLDLDLEYIELSNCDGIGLYRTEIAFMTSEKMPSVTKQVEIYRKLLGKAKDKRVVFRSLDVGSDKLLPYWGEIKEENPAIGWRSVRITLDRRSLLRTQMRAFIEAAAGRELDVMFPMISSLDEFLSAKETLMLEYQKQLKAGLKVPTKIRVGLMIEVPSVIFELDDIFKQADFISIGTNDLAQFIFASDRTNPRLIDRYDVLSAPFLKVMKYIVLKAKEHHVLCSVCGEMASNPLEALALLGLGYRHFSCAGSAFASIKKMVRSAHVDDVCDYLETLILSNRKSLRPQLKAYAKDHGIAI